MSSLSVKPIFSYGKRAAKWVFDKLPSIEFRDGKILDGIKWAGQHISSPQNRVILGATALMSQPFIDLHNRNVDEETRKVSAARTVAKILAGTTTGFFVRHYSIKAVDAFTKNPEEARRFLESLLFPKGIAKTTIKGLTRYKKALGTYISLGVMLFTNFAIDAPLTKFLTNIFVKEIKDYDRNRRDAYIVTPQIQNSQAQKVEEEQKNVQFIPRVSFDLFIKGKGAS